MANGLLALADVTDDAAERDAYVDAAAAGRATSCVAAQEGAPGRWPDYRDPDETAAMAYTSFDDGAAGIADLLWTMWGAHRRRALPRRRPGGHATGSSSRAEGVDDVRLPGDVPVGVERRRRVRRTATGWVRGRPGSSTP